MRKASDILLMVGIVLTLMALTFTVVLTIASFMISSSGYTETLIDQLKNGLTPFSPSGTYEEQAKEIQDFFRIYAVIMLLISLICIAKFVITIMLRRNKLKAFYITSLVLSLLSADVILILANIFGLIANKNERDVEEINTSI